MKIMIAAGGTGGTLYPGIAIAQAIHRRAPSAEVVFIGARRSIETLALQGTAWRLITFPMPRIKDRSLLGRLWTMLQLPVVLLRMMRFVWRFKPSLAIGIGGYAAGPISLAAALQGIPTVIVVPDVIPGLANRWLSHFARRIFLGFDEAARFFPAKKVCVTGNPVRNEVIAMRHVQPPSDGRFTILCFGGSQGARRINQAMREAIPFLASKSSPFRVIHQTGSQEDIASLCAAYAKGGVPAEVHPFLDRIWEYYAHVDLVIARAGASSIAELSALQKPAILIPYPHAADDHQRANAESVVRLGGAEMILEKELTGEKIAQSIQKYIEEPKKLSEMSQCLERSLHRGAADRIVDECWKLMKAA